MLKNEVGRGVVQGCWWLEGFVADWALGIEPPSPPSNGETGAEMGISSVSCAISFIPLSKWVLV